jgi:hypothetical protein
MTFDRFWLVLGGVVAVATLAVGIYGFYFTHHEASKGIEATLISRSQLLNPETRKKLSDLGLLNKEHDIPDIGILQIRLRNSGAQPITKADIEEPITFPILGAKEIISAPIVQTRPPGLPIQATISGSNVELNKTLLNPDDSFTVEVDAIAAAGAKLDISNVAGRVAGVQTIVFQKSLPAQASSVNDSFWKGLVSGVTPVIITIIAFIVSSFQALTKKAQGPPRE